MIPWEKALSSKDAQQNVLAWVGAATGVLSVVLGVLAIVHPEGFPVRPELLAYMCLAGLLATAIATGAWRWLRKMIERPDIETDSIEVALTIEDRDGKSATLTRTQVDLANRKVFSHTLAVGGIGSDGQIEEIWIDGETVPQSQWERQVTMWRVTKTQQKVLSPGDRIKREFRMKLLDSFVEKKETLSHDVANEAKQLTLKVKFPENRNPTTVASFLALGNVNREELAAPLRDSDGFHSISIRKPQLGGTYRIEWEW